ncbi:type VI secretion system-associated FHA domain protein [Rhizobium lentis]|uniref:Putative component of type VI protein secretion system n=1 Tax=Rhizobium lentis TaxID=1138194 RepID=A0A7W8XJB3_9HYPH|nr:type VI secretion system-associated FHA domain protein [Rhizobium lentis]MBB4577299.1 putative component of type VI protein secretion system [Rhizobium lentis]MBB5553886.1 putative component of type VI protein secretion system [Rhizobium lentis]MBB5563854.1 putative component of type VI protein secretion system [Rhizobium lentis]MBB5570878.1 putative component of type VI protein secretion system [Rhizobium lentis]
MPLTLRVHSNRCSFPEYLVPGDAAGGLTTSRAGNSLVLPDDQQMVSKYHCSIECMARRYGLIDRGRGNTCLSDEAVPLPSEAPVARKTSDVIQIGAYRIDVVVSPSISIAESAAEPEGQLAATSEELSFLGPREMASSLLAGKRARGEEALLDLRDGEFPPLPVLDTRFDALAGMMRSPLDIYADSVPDRAPILAQPKVDQSSRQESSGGRHGFSCRLWLIIGRCPECRHRKRAGSCRENASVFRRAAQHSLRARAGEQSFRNKSSDEKPLRFVPDVRGFLRGDLAIEHAFADRGTHDVFFAAVQKALSSVRARLSLAGIEKAMGRTRSLLHRNHKARNRSAYVRVFNDVVSNIETDLLRSFGADFARPVRERRRPARRSHDESVRSEGKWAG